MDNLEKAEQAGLLEERRARDTSVPNVDAHFTLQHGIQRLRLAPFSILVCTKCKTLWRFNAYGRLLGPEFRSPCGCGSTQFILPRRAPAG
jgi:hypothetical protein